MFKKIIVCFSLVFILILLNSTKEKTELVYKEIDNNNNDEYSQIYLLFENNSLTTNNFEDYLKYFRILKIYPYINPIYVNRIKANYSYTFNYQNHTYDLSEFKQSYIKNLKNLGLVSEANNYDINGVVINKVLVHTTMENINMFFKNFPNIKYSYNLNGIYKKIGYS